MGQTRFPTEKPVVNWLTSHVGHTFNVADMMPELPDGVNERTVVKLLTTDLPRKGFKIETLVRGTVFRFNGYTENGKEATAAKLFEQIGVAKDGKLVLQCDDGTIFLAVEVG